MDQGTTGKMIFQTKLTTKELQILAAREAAKRFTWPHVETIDQYVSTTVVKDGIEVVITTKEIK